MIDKCPTTAEELTKYQYGGVNIRLADDQMERLISALEKHNTIKVGDEDIPIQEAEDMLAEAKINEQAVKTLGNVVKIIHEEADNWEKADPFVLNPYRILLNKIFPMPEDEE